MIRGVNHAEHDGTKSGDRLSPGGTEGPGKTSALFRTQGFFKGSARGTQVQLTLATIRVPDMLLDQLLFYQFAQDPGQALLGNMQDIEQFRHGNTRIARNEINGAVMRPTKIIPRQNLIRLGNKIPVGIEQQFHTGAQIFITQEQGVGSRWDIGHLGQPY